MNTLRDELNEIISSEKIRGIEFLRMNNWQWIMDKLAENFLSHGKQSLERIWLWEAIEEPYASYQPDDGIEELNSLLCHSDTYWFIASDEDGKYWVLEGTGEAIVSVLSETRYFEYYITNKEISWLICENHHGVMVLKGPIASERENA
ncbi:DUF6756 family protein [Pleionea litopenaei]|uniref:Uncharacterized protein n=1 Tax=Pleionea litopenaei TaxID=3070815 RepID=A0AA51RS83_9GAMM|nr:DUF6756 family protein [Pleionea sp. HL-JVS1]WMS86585.1 hypothetical protein Q9312_15295 [Pleionea sp. HL-JVS1]